MAQVSASEDAPDRFHLQWKVKGAVQCAELTWGERKQETARQGQAPVNSQVSQERREKKSLTSTPGGHESIQEGSTQPHPPLPHDPKASHQAVPPTWGPNSNIRQGGAEPTRRRVAHGE